MKMISGEEIDESAIDKPVVLTLSFKVGSTEYERLKHCWDKQTAFCGRDIGHEDDGWFFVSRAEVRKLTKRQMEAPYTPTADFVIERLAADSAALRSH